MFESVFFAASKDISAVEIPQIILNSPISAFEGKLYIGSAKSLQQHILTKYNIKHVLCCTQELIEKCSTFPVQVQAVDPHYIPQVNAEILENAFNYISTTTTAMQKNVLLVDADGVSKAAVVAVYYLMRSKQISLVQAVNVVESSRKQRLQLDENMAILGTKFEEYIFGRNTMVAIRNRLVPIEPIDAPELHEESARRLARRRKAQLYRECFVVAVLAAIVAFLAYRVFWLSPKERLITPLPASLIFEGAAENVSIPIPTPAPIIPFFPAFLPVTVDIKKKCTIPSSLSKELDSQSQSMRNIFKQFSDGYIKDYSSYSGQMHHYERLANNSLNIYLKIKEEEKLEKAYAIPEDYQHAQEEYQKELKLGDELTRLDKERKKIAKNQLSAPVNSLFTRRSALLKSYAEQNYSLHDMLDHASLLLSNTTIFYEDYAKKERNESDTKMMTFPLQIQEIERQIEGRLHAIAEFERLNEGYRSDFQQQLSLLKADEASTKESLQRWAIALDNMIVDSEKLTGIGQLSGFAEQLQQLAKQQLQTWQKEIVTLEARKVEVIEELKKLEAERLKLEQTLDEAKNKLIEWNVRLETEKSTLRAMDITVKDINNNGGVPCNGFSIQFAGISSIASYLVTTTDSSAFTNPCLDSDIGLLQRNVIAIKVDMFPKQQEKINAMNDYAKKVSKKRVFVDKREALELQKNASALARDYKAAMRAVAELRELNKQFETIDSELSMARSRLTSADVALKQKEKELLISELALREGVMSSRIASVKAVISRLEVQNTQHGNVNGFAAVTEIDELYTAEEKNLRDLISFITEQEEVPVKIQLSQNDVKAELGRIEEDSLVPALTRSEEL